jgi:hypothetical protein
VPEGGIDASIRGSRTGHVTRPKGARLPCYLAALSRARDRRIIGIILGAIAKYSRLIINSNIGVKRIVYIRGIN